MMPGIGFEEMILLVLVAIVVIGPKDLPLTMRKFGRFTGKMRAMAFEFKQGIDELGRQAELEELKKEVADLKKSTGLDDLRREFEDDKRNMESDVRSALAAPDAVPAPATAAEAPALLAADTPAAESPEPAPAKVDLLPGADAIAAPPLGEENEGSVDYLPPQRPVPRERTGTKWPKPHKRTQPGAAAAAAIPTLPYAGLSADHPGYDEGVADEVSANGDDGVHVIPDDEVRPAHPAAKLAPSKQDTPA